MKKIAVAVLALALAASLVAFFLYFGLQRNYDKKSLAFLKKQAVEVKARFEDIALRLKTGDPPMPLDDSAAGINRLLELFRNKIKDPETEGLAFYDPSGSLVIWHGRVISLKNSFTQSEIKEIDGLPMPFLVKDKASVFLAYLAAAEKETGFILRYILLAFIPQVESLYVREYHALGKTFGTDFKIDYWDFREDVAGFDGFFARNADIYVGTPQKKNDIQTLFFPIRNQSGRIMATVTTSSPSLSSRLIRIKEDLALFFIILGLLASVIFIFRTGLSPAFLKGQKPWDALMIILFSATARMAALPLARLERTKDVPLFSPASAGFISPAGLMSSPFDVFLTALAFLPVSICLVVLAKNSLRKPASPLKPVFSVTAAAVSGLVSAGIILLFQALVRAVACNSSLSLERWPPAWPSIVIHLGLAAGLASALFLIYAVLSMARSLSGNSLVTALSFLLPAMAFLILAGNQETGAIILGRILVLLVPLIAVFKPETARNPLTAVIFLAVAAFWMSCLFGRYNYLVTRKLIETTIKHAAVSQEMWGKFLIDQTFLELERSQRSIVSFLKDPADRDFARLLWSRTSVAATNWYSCLEIRDAAGKIQSRFALNVPKFYGSQPVLEPSDLWSTARATMEFLGEKKEFLVGYKDFSDETHYLGRLIIYLSLDPEMLPFTYTANPYFEALRSNPMPSLNQFDFDYAVFDRNGGEIFNPRRIAWRPSAADLAALKAPDSSSWLGFSDRGVSYEAYLFPSGESFHALFIPHRKFTTGAVALLRLFFLYLFLAAALSFAFSLIIRKTRLGNPLRSFSNRVYAAFLAAALIPLVSYSVLTTDIFNRVFNQRFIGESVARAEHARNMMEAFLIVQRGEISPYLAPSEDLAFWISSTLSNDINIYKEGVLLASSRGEIYSSGLAPDVLDGEAYAALVLEKKPFFTRKMRLGRYSYQTLIMPYQSGEGTLFISLPLPFEKQELRQATGEIAEFLVLISSLFVILVMLMSRSIRSLIIVPVGKLLSATRAVSLGSLDVEIQHHSRDEMMTLVEGFNTMVKNLKAREQELAEMSKKVVWAEMAGKIAHEIKNPLTPIQLSAEHVLKVYDDKKGDFDRILRESISYIIKEVEHLRCISQEFMELARDKAIVREPVNIREIIEETAQPYSNVLKDRIKFEISFEGPEYVITGDRAKLQTAFRNIIANATESVSRRGTVTIKTAGRAGKMTVTISDSGPGMSRETLDRIFEPYFSTKDSGTGLGLPIAKKIIEEHGGSIRVESRPGAGTRVEVDLPAGSDESGETRA